MARTQYVVPDAVHKLSTAFGRFAQADLGRFEQSSKVLDTISQSLSQLVSLHTDLLSEHKEQNRLLRAALNISDPPPATQHHNCNPPPAQHDVHATEPQNPELGEVEEHNNTVQPMSIGEKEEILGVDRECFEGVDEEEARLVELAPGPSNRRKRTRANQAEPQFVKRRTRSSKA